MIVEKRTPTPVATSKPKVKDKPKSKPKITVQSSIAKQVTVVIVNFKTKRLLACAYKSFRKFYPTVRMIFVDSGSMDESRELVKEIGGRAYNSFILFSTNVGHGPAMHQAIQEVDTPFVLTLDTDTETFKKGFLEKMVRQMKANDNLYALGWKRWVDRLSGVPLVWFTEKQPSERFVAYIHPSAGLYRMSMYRTLNGFVHHGAPCLHNMNDAVKRGFELQAFPISDYVKHLKAGTRRMYGGRWDPTNKTPRKKWKARDSYPI